MIYLDTNVVISYADELDPNHERALEILESLEGERVTSRLTLLELVSVYSRAGLPQPLAHALYSLKLAKAKLVDVDLGEALMHALKLAPHLRLRTLDLLHIALAILVGARVFITLDKEIKSRNSELEKLGLRLI